MTSSTTNQSTPTPGRTDWSEPLSAWPELDVASWSRWRVGIADTCTAVLGGRRPPPLVAANETDAWTAGIAAFTTGMGPLLGYWVERGDLTTDALLAERLRAHLDHSRRRYRRLAAEAVRIIAALAGAGVPVVVLKGLHSASYHPEPGTRAFSDIDLLIAPRDRSTAEGVLRGQGLTAGQVAGQQRCTWYPADLGQLHSLEFSHAANPWSLDLHWTLTRTRFRALELRLPDVAPEACPSWDALGAGARILPVPLLIPLLAIQAVEHLRLVQLLRIVDLVLVIRAESGRGTLDWQAVDDLLARHDLRHFVYPAFCLAERLVPGTVDSAFLGGLERSAPTRMVRAVAALDPAGDPDPRIWSFSELFLWARGPGDWARLAWRQLWPGVGYGTLRDFAVFYQRRLRRLWRREVRLRPARRA